MIFSERKSYHDGYRHDKTGLPIIPPTSRQNGDVRRRPNDEDAAREEGGKDRSKTDTRTQHDKERKAES